ncbi:hypothetical protein DFW101_2320 [Solidesulfovibrio carbinoliphilus subsp. oakridgensis]|uniref:HhH-GPD family protein n=1 Tax=Solidesulfovibrio carbinoliphilus subsp. oakridgensis TaxID=694327 RepID=G7QAY4_9BACT|nr:hypothetical protein [Solidesulfovibrio carbinoliphilus]EHJ48325.1 hypothetical protein DFW101_2320 [Solidesulfovibrio carbinoliphilus subsp. oakridgensis]
MQVLTYLEEGQVRSLTLPSPEEEVMPGIRWGECEKVFTPAYWAYQACRREKYITTHRLGNTLLEEIVACILGGFGIPAEVGMAAFYEVRRQNCFDHSGCSMETIYNILSLPIDIKGKKVKYRFAKQKAKYINNAIVKYHQIDSNFDDPLTMRSWLLKLIGIGPKTASWITRNWLGSDEVAILDVHIFRAGLIAGFFSTKDSVASDYFQLEKKFLNFAESIKTKASTLDAIMWADMRVAHRTVSTHFS